MDALSPLYRPLSHNEGWKKWNLLYANEASVPLLEIWKNRNWTKTSFASSSFCPENGWKREALNIEVKGNKKRIPGAVSKLHLILQLG
jgi:hypothetical protein